ncbi:PEP-CTERM sorting domain-containing protein [bacterium]|nr:PEP-CTERM sorting domain-containing protein [bacterium]
MKNNLRPCALLLAAASILAAIPATAANTFYAPGDLVLYFQQEGGGNTVYANLGNAALLYRGTESGAGGTTSQLNIVNLNTTLTSAFGSGWASDSTVYAGLAGVFSTSTTSNVLTNGDPARTLYLSSPRNSVGTVGEASSTAWDLVQAGNTAVTAVATGIQQQNNVLENSYSTAVTVSLTSISQIDDQNPFMSPGIQGNAFGDSLEGGVQQRGSASVIGAFGDGVGNGEFALDLYRVLAKNTISGQVGGGLREGSFEGTVVVGSSGNVSFVAIPEPSSTALIGLGAGALLLRRRRRSA